MIGLEKEPQKPIKQRQLHQSIERGSIYVIAQPTSTLNQGIQSNHGWLKTYLRKEFAKIFFSTIVYTIRCAIVNIAFKCDDVCVM